MIKSLLLNILILSMFSQLFAQDNKPFAKLWSEEVLISVDAKEFFVSPAGNKGNNGSRESPWDLESVVLGKQKVPPGSVIWVIGGKYNAPKGVTLSGTKEKPVHLRAFPEERATIDGGLPKISGNYLWIWGLEMASFKPDWRPAKAIGKTDSFKQMPGAKGSMEITGGKGSKFINLVIHNNIMGVGYWKNVTDSEMHGCIIYDNGYPGTDRPHGPGIYTQNMTKTPRLITDNIIAGNFSTGMQMYGSKIDLMVNDFLVEGNVWFAPRVEAGNRNYILCGGEKSQNISIKNNFIYGYRMHIGSKANQISEGNTVIHSSLSSPTPEKNRNLKEGKDVEVTIRPNKYDPGRANLIVLNWPKSERIKIDLNSFLKKDEKFKIFNALNIFGQPLAEGKYDGAKVTVPIPQIPWKLDKGSPMEMAVYIIIKE